MTTGKVTGGEGKAWCVGSTAKCFVSFFKFDKGDYSVVSTDYDNYTVVRNCETYLFGLFRWEVYWILSRATDMPTASADQAKAQL